MLDFERRLREPVAAAGRDVDVLAEARLKDLAVLRLREQLLARGVTMPAGAVRNRPGPPTDP